MPRMPTRLTVTDELPADAVLVCAPKGQGHFADDVEATCSRCRRAIVHRPDMAAVATKICLSCYLAQAHPDDKFLVTPRSLAECKLHLSPPKGRG